MGFDGGHGAGGTPAISPYFGAVVGGDGGTDVRWRPSGGAKLKGRGCTRQKDAAVRRSA